MRKCARCGLLSPDQSMRCECGFDFQLDDKRSVRRDHAEWRTAARWRLAAGLVMLTAGLVISTVTYFRAVELGGRFVFTHGLIIVGAVTTIRGAMRLRKIRDIERE